MGKRSLPPGLSLAPSGAALACVLCPRRTGATEDASASGSGGWPGALAADERDATLVTAVASRDRARLRLAKRTSAGLDHGSRAKTSSLLITTWSFLSRFSAAEV